MKELATYIIEKLQINKDSKLTKLPEIQDAFEYSIKVAEKLTIENKEYAVIDIATKLEMANVLYGVDFEVTDKNFNNQDLLKKFAEEVLVKVKEKYNNDTDKIKIDAYDNNVYLIVAFDDVLPDEVLKKNESKSISEKLHIDKHINIHQDDQITKDFKKLGKLLRTEGADEEVYNSFLEMMEFYDDEYEDYYYKWDERKFYTFFREIVNYDWISLYGGKVNVAESNHKEIAKILKKYATKEIIKKTMASFGWS